MIEIATDIVGWSAAAVLLATIGWQVYVQWRSGAVAGVSPWLFTGQLIASAGFLVYSVLLQNWVFVATNGMIAVAALFGKCVDSLNRRRAGRRRQHDGDGAATVRSGVSAPESPPRPARPPRGSA